VHAVINPEILYYITTSLKCDQLYSFIRELC